MGISASGNKSKPHIAIVGGGPAGSSLAITIAIRRLASNFDRA